MSLAEQSQQWFPTSVQVTVHQARNLRIKGKNGTNDSYAIIQVAKDKFSTSVAEKCVDPVWKEEASFDLPLFHPSNAERCTLYVIVMHRAQVGLDKFLGQAVVNLVNLHDDKSRKKSDWYKLVDKTGKEDKARGEVLLDVVFMRNNLSASMFDLSMQDKPRSRLSKLKDKVRGKKKDGFSDSASAIVPSVSQVMTDSEGELDAQSLNQSPGVKKKSKLKTLFAPKSNLHRNVSQSMSTLGNLPEKNSSLSGSRSSGLNIDSPDVKKKFKFLGHKRNSSTDSKSSLGAFSLLGRPKKDAGDLTCINGSHVYAEEAEAKSGSTLSLNSSGQGSLEDIRKHTFDIPADSLSIPVPAYNHQAPDRATLEKQRHQEEQQRRQAEEKLMTETRRREEEEKRKAETRRREEEERRGADARKLEEEEKRRAEARRLQEEEQRKNQQEQEKRGRLEDEARKKKQREEEEERRRAEEGRLEEQQRRQEEAQRAEEQKKQEEASMTDRISTLFGMIRKKEEKKEEVNTKDERSTPDPHSESSGGPDPHRSQPSSNPFVDIPLDPDAGQQKPGRTSQTPSAMVFLNRTAKVSAVKPRLDESLKSESTDCSTDCPSPATPESTLSSVPADSPFPFSSLHTSLAPPSSQQSESPPESPENLSPGSSPTMSQWKQRSPLPPTYPAHGGLTGLSTQMGQTSRTSSGHAGSPVPVREVRNPGYVDIDLARNSKSPSIPLPDYESLFPEKRHGVQGHTKWDHLIAEVNQRHRDQPGDMVVHEMSVDGPEEHVHSHRSSVPRESSAIHNHHTHTQVAKPLSTKTVSAPNPPASTPARPPRDASLKQSQSPAQPYPSPARSNPPASVGSLTSDARGRDLLSTATSRDTAKRALRPPAATAQEPRPDNQTRGDGTPKENQTRPAPVSTPKEAPTARPRGKVNDKEPTVQDDSAVAPALPEKNPNRISQSSTRSSVNLNNKSRLAKENFAEFDPFPTSDLLPTDPWAQLEKNQSPGDIFTSLQKEKKVEDRGMTAGDLDELFTLENPTDPFSDSLEGDKRRGEDTSSPAFQRTDSQRRRQVFIPVILSNDTDSTAKEEPSVTSARHSASFTPQPHTDGGLDSFGAHSFTARSTSPALTSPEPLPVILEESASQAAGLSGGKTPLRAWVSPTDSVSAQNSNGGGLASIQRRPHPVKPMSSAESQQPFSAPAARETKSQDANAGRIKAVVSAGSGPYTQLTQDELITLVVKQQTDMTRKEAKIEELEQYIDNLLVRVIEEQPGILQSLNASKPV